MNLSQIINAATSRIGHAAERISYSATCAVESLGQSKSEKFLKTAIRVATAAALLTTPAWCALPVALLLSTRVANLVVGMACVMAGASLAAITVATGLIYPAALGAVWVAAGCYLCYHHENLFCHLKLNTALNGLLPSLRSTHRLDNSGILEPHLKAVVGGLTDASRRLSDSFDHF